MLRSETASSTLTTDQLVRAARLLMRWFVGRTNRWAEQRRDGRCLRRNESVTDYALGLITMTATPLGAPRIAALAVRPAHVCLNARA